MRIKRNNKSEKSNSSFSLKLEFEVLVFGFLTMWWSVHLEGGPRRVNHAAAAVGDRIFSFGGYCKYPGQMQQKPVLALGGRIVVDKDDT